MTLCIIQARMGSSRLPGKPLRHVRGVPLIQCVWDACVDAFGSGNVVVAHPYSLDNEPLRVFLRELGALNFGWDGPADDVLGRLHACAFVHRDHPNDRIVRVCGDNPFLDPYKLKRTADGTGQWSRREGGEAFSLWELIRAQMDTPANDPRREHVTAAFAGYCPPPVAPPRAWSIDTQADLDRCNAHKTYVVDVDGTLCYIEDGSPPRTEIIERVNALYDAGHTIILETARRASLEERTREQLETWGVRFDRLRCGHKLPADYYVDDLGMKPEELPHAA